MLWQQDRNKKRLVIAPIESRSNSLSHGFSNHPFVNNSKTNNNVFIPSNAPSYSPELWHYGVKGMHWGEITKKNEPTSYSSRYRISKPTTTVSSVKEAKARIANLQNMKNKVRQNKEKRIVRFKNKVMTIRRRPKRTKEEIVESGANKINKIIDKTNNTIDKGISFSDVVNKFLSKRIK